MVKVRILLALASISTVLSGCYVVPVNQAGGNYQQPAAAAPAPVVRPVYTARLYPVNDHAASMGRIAGTISNPERGHGEFAFSVANETYVGEATRATGSAKGSANAAGNRGGYVKCIYTMSSTVLGTGSCTFSSGAVYDMHISL